jgi:hypothetical protein
MHLARHWFDAEELSALQRLTQLRTLWLTGVEGVPLYASDPVPFLLPRSLLGQLEELCYFYTNDEFRRPLADYGRACPNVRTLLVDDDAFWRAAERRSPAERLLFPDLERLAVRTLTLVDGADHASSR